MANNIDVKDAAAATVTMKTTDNAGVHTAHHNVDSSALPTGAATESTLAAISASVDGLEALATTLNGYVDGIEGLLAGTLTVSGTVSATNLDIRDLTSVSDSVAAAQSGTWNITNVSGTVSLPTGAATEATLATLGTETTLAAIAAALGGTITISGTVTTGGLTDTQLRASAVPVSAASLPLPTGAATETTLASALTALQLIDNIVSGTGVNISQINGVAPLMGTGNTGTGALRVNLTADGTGQVAAVGKANHDAAVSGAPVLNGGYASAAAPANVSANGDVVRAWHLLNGAQATVLTAAGALIGGDATYGLDVDVTRLPALPAGTNNIGDVDVLSLPALPSGTNNIGDVDVVSLPVATSGGDANVTSSATNVTLLASNAARKGASIMNDSTEVLYVKFGATASATSFHVKMAAGSYLEVPFGYTGIIDGIWASANGSARVGEFT